MPTIEVSQEQAEALARGESITLAPKPKKVERYLWSNQNTGAVVIIEFEDGEAKRFKRLAKGVCLSTNYSLRSSHARKSVGIWEDAVAGNWTIAKERYDERIQTGRKSPVIFFRLYNSEDWRV